MARLSELGEGKVGRLTFHLAAVKLGRFRDEASAFSDFVNRNRLCKKRNRDVSHEELPGRLSDHRQIHIPYRVLIRAVGFALRLTKRIDRHVVGPSAPYLWREARKRRYDFMYPPSAGYMLVPYLHLSGEDRIRIVAEELQEGQQVWSEVSTTIDGQPATIPACKKWGILALGGRLLALHQYPLQELASIETNPPEPGGTEEPPPVPDA